MTLSVRLIFVIGILLYRTCFASPPVTVDDFFEQCNSQTAKACNYYLVGSIDQIALQANKASCHIAIEERNDRLPIEVILRLGDMQKSGKGSTPLWRAVRIAVGESINECALP